MGPDETLSTSVIHPVYLASTDIKYDADGHVETVTENGVTTTYTCGPDGGAADTRDGVTRTYNGSGKPDRDAS